MLLSVRATSSLLYSQTPACSSVCGALSGTVSSLVLTYLPATTATIDARHDTETVKQTYISSDATHCCFDTNMYARRLAACLGWSVCELCVQKMHRLAASVVVCRDRKKAHGENETQSNQSSRSKQCEPRSNRRSGSVAQAAAIDPRQPYATTKSADQNIRVDARKAMKPHRATRQRSEEESRER